MKCVLLISPIPPPKHGAAVASELLLRKFQKNKQFHFTHIDAKFSDNVQNLSVFSINKVTRLLRYLVQFVVERFRGNAEVVIMTPTFYSKPFLKDSVFLWLAWFLRVPRRIAWLHMSFKTMQYDSLNPLFQWYIKATFKRCTHYVCVAESLLDELPLFMSQEKRLAVMNGVETKLNLDNREQSTAPLRIIYLSNIDIEKGWNLLFEVSQDLIKENQGKEIEVYFYGNPTRNTSAKEIEAAFEDAPKQLHYKGFVDGEAKQKAYANADIFCLPSFNEAFPLTVLEAMAQGVAVVASDVGAVSEALVDGKGGVLVPARNKKALKEGLQKLINDPQCVYQMGEFNRQRFLEKFTVESYSNRWAKALNQLYDTLN